MSIMIKGMDLPECCDKCPFKKYIGYDRLVCGITGYRFYAFDVGWGDKPYIRHESCPLVEIPDKHGRLIDADALIECLATLLHFPSNLVNGQWIVNTLREQPTIIPAEPPSGCEDCKYWDGERCANSNGKDCHNSILWWPKEGRE